MFICKHCSKHFFDLTASQKGNHTRWCTENPKRATYCGPRAVPQFKTEEVKIKRAEGLKKAHRDGKYTAATFEKGYATKLARGTHRHTEESKSKIAAAARASKHRRLIRSRRPYIKKDGTTVILDSSWEEALAKRLDYLNVEWVRPDPIEYVDNEGVTRNYFPDFYLKDYDVFLDPKNPAAIATQKLKLDILKKKVYNLIIIDNLKECKTFQPNMPA